MRHSGEELFQPRFSASTWFGWSGCLGRLGLDESDCRRALAHVWSPCMEESMHPWPASMQVKEGRTGQPRFPMLSVSLPRVGLGMGICMGMLWAVARLASMTRFVWCSAGHTPSSKCTWNTSSHASLPIGRSRGACLTPAVILQADSVRFTRSTAHPVDTYVQERSQEARRGEDQPM